MYRTKQNFTAGEVSPLMYGREDFERFKNGCKTLNNMVVRTQGPASRRPGTRFIYDLGLIGIDPDNPKVREVDFVFNENQAYVILFYEHVSGVVRAIFGTGDGALLGSGSGTEYTSTDFQDYTGVGEYIYTFPPYSSVRATRLYHVDEDGTRTDLDLGTDYILDTSTSAGTSTVNVSNATITDGRLNIELDLTSVPIPVNELVYIDMPAGWDISTFDHAQSGDYIFCAQSSLPVHSIIRRAHDVWEVQEVTFTAQPTDWSDINGWPENVTLFQQRLSLAANITRRQTIWNSRAGDYYHFGKLGTDTVDADAVTFTLDSGTQNKIVWLQTVKQLHAGTIGNEWTISGQSQRAITPGEVLAERQTNNGSEKIKPLMVGLTTLFVEKFGRVVNEFVFDYNFDSFKTSDVTILAPHLTEQDSITSWAYQQTPDSVIWCVRDDGDIIALTYQRQHNVIGWHHHETDGKFLDVCSIPGDNREDEVWVVVNRFVEGEEKYYWEKMAVTFNSDDPRDSRFLDSYLVYEGESTKVLTGLSHLEGATVSILSEGAVHAPKVVENGSVTLDRATTQAVVGLPFESEVRPLLQSVNTEEGLSTTRDQRAFHLNVMLKDSVGMEIGAVYPDGEEIIEEKPFRRPVDITGQALPLFNGVYDATFPQGHSRAIDYFIRQKNPLPLTVVAIVDDMEVL